MSTIKELIKVVSNNKSQNDEGQFEMGSSEQQYATKFVELFFNEYDTVIENADLEELKLMTAAVINAMRDIQVRDYMMGIVPEIKNSINILEYLIEQSPKEYADSAIALVSLVYYENNRTEDAINTINEANNNYSLAVLLKRVFTAGWPVESFQTMRNELHPKVVATIFGDKE